MKTKLLLLALVLLSSVMAWAQNFSQDGVNYFIDGTTAYVGVCSEATGDVTILDKITVDGTDYPVTLICDGAFSYNANITSVVIPNSVTTIESSAFASCEALATVTIGSGVTFIGYDAFYYCWAVTDVYISADPNALTWEEGDCDDFNSDGNTVCHVDDAAPWVAKFSGIVNMKFRDANTTPFSYSYDEATHTLTISGTEAMLASQSNRPWGSYASEIENVVIEDGVPNIGRYAFSGCSSLTSVTIPSSVLAIGRYSFVGCRNLTSIDIPGNVRLIGRQAFENCYGLTSIDIPASVTTIEDNVFNACSNLIAINVASDNPAYKSIRGVLFSEDGKMLICCPVGMTSYVIEEGVESIDMYAFSSCSKLSSVTFPSSLTYIGRQAFSYCTALTSIVLPDNLSYIDTEAFLYCTDLTTVTLGNAVNVLYDNTFRYCSNLSVVNIGRNLSEIKTEAFSGCSSLSAFNVSDANPYYKSINGVIYSKDGTSLIKCPLAKTYLSIPEGVTQIASCACSDCTKLGTVNFPDGVETIGTMAFFDCTKLSSLAIPNSVTTIASQAFSGCTSLSTLVIPNSVTILYDNAFSHCKGLRYAIIGSGVTEIGGDAFYQCNNMTDVYIYANPETLEWSDADYDEFIKEGEMTVCHVFDADAFKAKWSTGDTETDVHAIFQGDLLPQVSTAEMCETNLTTYYNGTDNVKVDPGTTVYKVSMDGTMGDVVSATEIEDRIINAGQGVVLKSKEKTIAMTTTTETSSADYSDNVLEGVDVETLKPSGYQYYTLGQYQNDLVFVEIPGTKLFAHKAYLKTTSSPYAFYFDNATGIEGVQDVQGVQEPIYNLSGQRLNKMQKGINIIGGKKVLVK